MQYIDNQLWLSATDLSNFISCRHLTQLDKLVASGKIEKPQMADPYAAIVRELGLQHEKNYVAHLRSEGYEVEDLREIEGEDHFARTRNAMEQGAEVIVQAALNNDHWRGYADILYRVQRHNDMSRWDWSYEVGDTKLAQNTKAGTVLQLCIYSDLLAEIQGIDPKFFYVIKPGDLDQRETFRYQDYAAYYRLMKQQMVDAIDSLAMQTYPDPVPHCEICHWWTVCDKKRRADDHLSFIAGMHRHHIRELEQIDVKTLAGFAMRDGALEGRPSKGSIESYRRLHRQASMQYKGRQEKTPVYELIRTSADEGLSRLPQPSDGDVFFDIEGDRFYREGGLEYLLGIAFQEDGEMLYKCWWSLNRQEEKRAFEALMDFLMARLEEYPEMHIYHFAPYEQSALKRLMLRYSTRGEDLDWLLRAERMIDLHAIVRQSIIASVEKYGLKDLEPFFAFKRETDLARARQALFQIQRSLELEVFGGITPEAKEIVRNYNAEDCCATEALRVWLESLRKEYTKKIGHAPGRPILKTGEAKEEQEDKNAYIADLFRRLTENLPEDPEEFDADQQACWLLTHLLEYHSREKKNFWWEYYDRRDMDYEDLLEDRKAIAGLRFIEVLPRVGREQLPRHRYAFPPQEISVSNGESLDDLNDEKGDKVGTVVGLDLANSTIDIKKTRKTIDRHSVSVQINDYIDPGLLETALLDFAENVVTNGLHDTAHNTTGRDLLLKRIPRIANHSGAIRLENEKTKDAAIRSAAHLENSVLPIQGPPGCGKTYTGAHMILELLNAGKRIGVTAVSHKAIDNLLERIHTEAKGNAPLAHRGNAPKSNAPDGIDYLTKAKALEAVKNGVVLGATAFHWASEDCVDILDYLFIDEAGQMSLAYVLAISRCAKNIVMLGDPQQLQQPQKAAHPEGSDVSALSHYLGDRQTIEPEKGLFLDETWRLHPDICAFTSEIYYDGKLKSRSGLEQQVLRGTGKFVSGLYFVPVRHQGNRNQSDEEVAVIKRLIYELLSDHVRWTKLNEKGYEDLPLTADDIMVVAPYNAQVGALQRALDTSIAVGTVDKFQGREAAVVIYSMSSSSVEEAPRGMSFLFEPNRLNVASSRARCAFILVGSPELFEVECNTPKQMVWANGLCRYQELAQEIKI